ncbi:F-box-2 domain containing protein [Pyrenophora teres f. maculata]|nr:F-box-2 domain containing protein [Pyrenophora teres f. maculata]
MAVTTPASTSASSQKPVVEAPQHFCILDLPAELRNRIYDYCLDDGFDTFAPSVRVQPSKPHKERFWQFVGLSQVCKDVRSEFRPLWIKNLSMRFDSRSNLGHFIENFLHHCNGFNPVPRLLQYEWTHCTDNTKPFDITNIVRLRSHAPEFKVEFHPASVANTYPKRTIIDTPCAVEYHDYVSDSDDSYDEDYDAYVDEDSIEFKAWVNDEYSDIAYTHSMENLIKNGKEAWLQDIKDDKVTVFFLFSQPDDHAAIKFVYKDASRTDNSPPSAMGLLKRWGILENSELTATMKFVVSRNDEDVKDVGGFRITKMVERTTVVHKLPRT